ncbi:MAG: anaerobic sulfatase maturase [Burkholderiales bacterium]|nr:anaerobic sulfatase maturase [Burkholderiales bacterium]
MPAISHEFQVLAKPLGAVCNLDCSYCYYLRSRDLYPAAPSMRMDERLLESYIVQHIEACPTKAILFSWHGGEPTLLGLDYFRRVVALQRRHCPAGREILNGIQTNGTLIDDDWGRFLAAEKFYVGLSIDGPREAHDVYRISKSDRSTHRHATQAYRLLRRHGVRPDVLCVVHARNVQQPLHVYRFFRDLGVGYLQFLPMVARRPDGELRPETVPADAYGSFLCAIFDEWIRHDSARMVIQNFDEAYRPYRGMAHALCVFRPTCGDIAVVEHNGDFYSCDHFVDAAHCLGNIRERPLHEMLESAAQRAFGAAKKSRLPRLCRECEFLDLCNGGCPKDRFIASPEGEPGLNYLCSGLKAFFEHTRAHLRQLAALEQAGYPIEELARRLREADAQPAARAGRNDPCPCGSGKKYKRCCIAGAPRS